MSTETMDKSNRATVLLELLKETIGVQTPIEKTTWREISQKFGELMEKANEELRTNSALQNMPEFIEEPEVKQTKKARKKNETIKN